MRAPLALFALLVLSACGEPEPQTKVSVDGPTIDLGAMQEAGKRAQAMAGRTLTPADVEKFIALMPEINRLGREKNDKDMAKFMETHGLQVIEWGPLFGRIMAAMAALKNHDRTTVHEKTRADAAVVRPYLDRLEAAMKAK